MSALVPVRVQRSRARGYRMPPNTVSVARPSIWGNPFVIGTPGIPDAATAVRLYEHSLDGHWTPDLVAGLSDDDAARIYLIYTDHLPIGAGSKLRAIDFARAMLRGKNLACFCPLAQPCHADVLLRLANDGAA